MFSPSYAYFVFLSFFWHPYQGGLGRGRDAKKTPGNLCGASVFRGSYERTSKATYLFLWEYSWRKRWCGFVQAYNRSTKTVRWGSDRTYRRSQPYGKRERYDRQPLTLSNVAFTGHSSHPNTLIPSTFTDFCTALRNIFVWVIKSSPPAPRLPHLTTPRAPLRLLFPGSHPPRPERCFVQSIGYDAIHIIKVDQ